MTEELFQKYIDGACGIQERREVEVWLDTSSDEEREAFLRNRWFLADEEFSYPQTIELWNKIYGKIDIQQEVGIKRKHAVSIKIWFAAACIMLVTPSLYIITVKRNAIEVKTKDQIVKTKKTVIDNDLVTIVNNSKHRKDILLPDGSRVMLSQKSLLQYSITSESDTRKIYLSGRAEFIVAKNKKKPFTVYSGEIATTAVGTRFEVSNEKDTDKIMVKLIEGIVSVRSTKRELSGWVNNRLLHAGGVFVCGRGKASFYVYNQLVTAKTNAIKSETHSVGKELVFNHTPLTEVFEKMEMLYQIKIIYQNEDLDKKFLTSTVKQEDEPVSLLQAIAQMNDLTVTKTEEGFSVKRKEKEE